MRRPALYVLLVAALVLASCAQPPQAEIDAAKTALDVAERSADVVTYAPDTLRAAQEKMASLDAEIAAQARRSALSRNYDAAKTLAEAALALGHDAVDTAATTKAQVARDAESLSEEITAAIPGVERRVWAARGVRRINLSIINEIQSVPNSARATLADAQKDIASGAYATAKAKLLAVRDQLTSCEETITEQTRIAKSR
jgi:hypothetical protein